MSQDVGGLGGLKPLQIIGDGEQGMAAPVGAPVEAVPGNRTSAKVLVVGSGPAGLTAAIYAARANLEPIVLGGYEAGGQLMITSEVENFPGFPEGIQGPELMDRMRAHAERFGALVVDVDVERVDLSKRPFRLWAGGVEYQAETVIVASGASALWLELESESRLRGRGVSACATCDGFFFRDRKVVVVGGGDTALEEALFLTRYAREVVMVHRRDQFRGSHIMQERALANPKVRVLWNSRVVEVLGAEQVSGVRLQDTVTGAERDEPTDGLFIAIGHRPNTGVFREWLEVDDKGYLAVHEDTRTRIDGVFVAGDVHDSRYRQAITAAGDGCRAAIDAERWLAEHGLAEPATMSAW